MKYRLILILLFYIFSTKISASEEYCSFEEDRDISYIKSLTSDGGTSIEIRLPPHNAIGELYSVRIVYGDNENDWIAFDAEFRKYDYGYSTNLIVPTNHEKIHVEAIYHFKNRCNSFLEKIITIGQL